MLVNVKILYPKRLDAKLDYIMIIVGNRRGNYIY